MMTKRRRQQLRAELKYNKGIFAALAFLCFVA